MRNLKKSDAPIELTAPVHVASAPADSAAQPSAAALSAVRFRRLCKEAMLAGRHAGDAGIGTLQEKRLHSVIKKFICENEDFHEVGVAGTRYVSDIRIGNEIYEVQTGSFFPLRKKIEYYLQSTDCVVTVVHPVVAVRWVSRIHPVTREISPRRRSPKKERPIDLLPELYYLLPLLGNPRLRFRVLVIEAQDFRVVSGKSRRDSEKYERIPLDLYDDLSFDSPEDFRALLPPSLPQTFPAKTFANLTGVRGINTYSALKSLSALRVLSPNPTRPKTWSIMNG